MEIQENENHVCNTWVEREGNLQLSFNSELATVRFVIYMMSYTPFFIPVWIWAFPTVRVNRLAIFRPGRGDVTTRTSSIHVLRQHRFVTAHILQWTGSFHTFHETRSSLPDDFRVSFSLKDELQGPSSIVEDGGEHAPHSLNHLV